MKLPPSLAPLRTAHFPQLPFTQCKRTFSIASQLQRRRPDHSLTSKRRIGPTYKPDAGLSPFEPAAHIRCSRGSIHTSAVRKSDVTKPHGGNGPNRTALHDLHIRNGGKMVPFAGYSMPVQYSDLSLSESHNWTREKCSLFDVGHMVQHHFSGPGAAAFLERLTPFSSANLQHNQSTLSCLLHPFTGGTVDDTVITRLGPELFYLVTNAACKEKDLAFFGAELEGRDKSQGAVEWTVREKWGLVALQGPLSADVLQRTLENLRVEDVNLKALYFGQCASVNIPVSSTDSATSSRPDFTLLISRGGYTGEDGFEISIPPDFTVKFAQLLLEAGGDDRLRLAGLGARDSLRLEAGMCLYGHDLNDDITPVEAGLSWVIHKDRRASGGFNGDATILRQLKPAKEGGGVKRRRVGLRIEHGPPAREGASISIGQDDTDSEEVGRVTSGCPSPTLGENIAMGYVESGHHKAGTKFTVAVRGKSRFTEVVKMPFVPSKYWKQAAGTSPG